MTPQQAVGLASRLFAIWLALASIQSWMFARAVQSQGLTGAAWLQYSVPAIYWLSAVVLWFFPLSIAHRLLPRTRFEDRMALPARQAVTVACVVFGLFVLLVRALPAFSAYLSLALVWIANGQTLATMDRSNHVELIEGGIQALVGLAFVFKARAIAGRIVPLPAHEHVSPSMLADSRLSESRL